MAETSYTTARVARQQTAELKREAAASKLREEKQLREDRKKEKDERRKERLEKEASTSECDSDDNGGPGSKGFSINRSGESADWAKEIDQMDQILPVTEKRPAQSPAALFPEKKTPRMTPGNSRTSSPVDPRRKLPPGNK